MYTKEQYQEDLNKYGLALFVNPLFVSNGFKSYKEDLIKRKSYLISSAKYFITQNYLKITDWSNLDLDIYDSTTELTKYFNNEKKLKTVEQSENMKRFLALVDKSEPKKDSYFYKFREDIKEKNRLAHNPIITLTDVCLDTFDEDFSLTINGRKHLWIDSKSVLDIANYIEENNI